MIRYEHTGMCIHGLINVPMCPSRDRLIHVSVYRQTD